MKALSSGRHGLALALTFMAVFALSAAPRAEVISIGESSGAAGLTVLAQGQTGIELRYAMAQFSIDDFDVQGETMQKIGLPGCFLPNEAGAPDLPGFGRTIAIPAGADVSFTVLNAETRTYTDLDVLPAAPIQFANDDTPPIYEKDPAIYGTRAGYPASPVILSERQTLRGVETVTLGITPFQYNPVSRELTVYTALDIRVDFAGGSGQWVDERLRNRYWESMLRDQLLNYEMLPAADFFSVAPTDNRTGCEYVIITAENATCLAWADSIRTWRQAEGISTEIFTTAQIGTSPNQIDQWLANAYNSWDVPPAAFLILGDYPSSGDSGEEGGTDGLREETLPGVFAPIYAGYCVADNIYADVNNDHMPDMAHGRICARTDVQMATMINKMFSSERDPVMDPGFYDRPLIAGGWQTERWFILCCEVIYGHQANALGKDPVREYAIYSGTPGYTWSTAPNTGTVVNYFGPSGLGYIPSQPTHLTDWSGNYVGINSAINDGAYFVLHRDHGLEIGWGEPAYNSGHVNMLTNSAYPFVFSVNCLTGKYNWAGTSFTENFHRFADKGAVGLIAASEVSYSFVNDVFVWGVFDSMWPDFDPGHGSGGTPATLLRPAFGHTSGKYYLRNSGWPYNSNHKNFTYALFHHHGDVFLTMHDQVPTPIAVSHGPELEFDVDTFRMQAEEGALIGLTVNGELIGVAEATGLEQLIPIIPQTREGSLRIVCTKANRIRYDVNIPISGFSSTPETAAVESSVRLSQVLPNPTAHNATIAFHVPAAADGAQVHLGVYDPSGRLVRALVNAPQKAGQHSVAWDGRDQRGEPVASGVYYCKLNAAGEQDRRRVVMLR